MIAVFLALAVGVVLGSGPLSDVTDDAGDQTSTASASTHEDKAAAAAAAAYADDVARATAGRTLSGRLNGRTVVLLTLPGADPTTVRGLAGLVKTAGGTVVGQYAVQPALVDPSGKSLV